MIRVLDFFGCPGAALRQGSHFACDDGEAAALLARARCFDGGIQRENVGLKGDAVDDTDDVGDLPGGIR